MVPDGGVLTLRDTEEPALLEQPTTLVGSVDEFTGAISGASFSTPPLSFDFEITDPLTTTVYVDATFSEVVPGSVTGSVEKADDEGTLGDVTIDATVKVDLRIEVGGGGPSTPEPPLIAPMDCTASPIALNLTSVEPYDSATQTVTLADADFSVPAVPTTSQCIGLIADGVNERLAGGGHSLSLEMAGPLHVPIVGDEETVTSLSVAPAGGSASGDEVTLDAGVVPASGAEVGVPGGIVQFFDGATLLGTVALDGTGAASLATSGLPVGVRQLSARYLGDETYFPSTSPMVEYLVAAVPTVAVDMAPTLLIGGFARQATITVSNPAEFGADVANARVDITIARLAQTQAVFVPNRMVVEWLDGDTWEPVTMATTAPRVIGGTIGDATGFPLAAGATTVIRVRLTAPFVNGTTPPATCTNSTPTCPGNFEVTASLQAVDPGTGDVVKPLAQAVDPFALVESTRRATTFPFTGGAPRPHTIRQGYSTNAFGNSTTQVGGLRPSGQAEIFVDGAQTLVRPPNAAFDDDAYVERVTVLNGNFNAFVLTVPDISPGTHFMTVRYLGDAFFAPSDTTVTFTVLPADGHPFVCREEGYVTKIEVGANVTFATDVPALAAAGSSIDLDVSSAVVKMNRQSAAGNSPPFAAFNDGTTANVGETLLTGIGFALGPDGAGTAGALERQGGTQISGPNPGNETTVDQVVTLHDPTASVTVAGDPGEVVPIELTAIELDYKLSGINPFPYTMMCTPVGGPMVLGEVLAAGTSVSVSPEGPVREGVDVEIDARTFPDDAAGTVAFSSDRDGALGSPVAVDDGGAAVVVDDLSVGTHVITASFNATDPNVPDTSGTATITVLPEFDCPTFAQSGNAAVVRLVYLELLGRCPDQGGFDYWKGRLDAGTTPEVFARAISATPEAVGRVVDDAYVTMLGRKADAPGKAFWVERMRTGTGRYDHLLADLGASPEFWTKAGSDNPGFVTRVYERLLNRPPDQTGQDFWVARLDTGTPTRTLILQLANLDEPLGVLVTHSHQQILDRNPTSGERTNGITHLRGTGDRSGLYAQLIGTDEFRTRAGTFPNPVD